MAKWKPASDEAPIEQENQYLKLEIYDLRNELKKKNVEVQHINNYLKQVEKQLHDWYSTKFFKHYDLHRKDIEMVHDYQGNGKAIFT